MDNSELTSPSDPTTLHLYLFECGTYAAHTKEEAIECYVEDSGAHTAGDFMRAIPDDEEIEVTRDLGEKWDDPREYARAVGKVQVGMIFDHRGALYRAEVFQAAWFLKLVAKEWAHRDCAPGYRFGDEP